jgi:uncharacterized protein YbjT (DUF2867 family)
MVATNGRTVTVFGGTGFLGRRIARHLRYREFTVRIASRHPDRGHRQFGPYDPQLQFVEANIHDERSVADALAGACGVVNAVSLYLERGQETFHSVHVESAQRVAAQALRAGARASLPKRLSPIGSLNIPKVAKKIISKEKPAGVNRRAWRHKTFNLSSNPFSGPA